MRPLLVLVLLCAVVIMAGCTGDDAPNVPDVPPIDGDAPQQQGVTYWWNDQVFYEVFVRSFQDSDGDGIGDLQGLIQRLDYLNDGDPETTDDLGVTALWLMPVSKSPSYHGYDTTDYETVEPDYGTDGDFGQLVAEAHARGMRIIVDYVMNHCSNQHPWFVASAGGSNLYGDWFVWRDSNPGWTQPWGDGPVWHWSEDRGAYYYGIFWSGMPDLNYANADVRREMLGIADHWLDVMGAEGFRLDAGKYLVEDDAVLENTAATLSFWREFRTHLDAAAPQAFTVGEAWDTSAVVQQYSDAGLHTCFEFSLADNIIGAARRGQAAGLSEKVTQITRDYPYHQYATFLTNHDMTRLFTQLDLDEGANRVAAAVLLTLPGVPFLYYGEEVGMQGSGDDRDKRRPMQWSDVAGAGFTAATPWWPVGPDHAAFNVATLQAEAGSLWHHYRTLVQARVASPALRRGTYHRLEASAGALYAFLRRDGDGDDAVVVVHNFSGAAAGGWTLSATRSQLPPGDYTATDLLTGASTIGVTVGEAGAIDGWSPGAAVAAHAVLLLQLAAVD